MTSKYAFWLKQGMRAFQLPVNPEVLKIGNKAQNQSVKIDGLGETTFLQAPNNFTISFTCELPAYWYPGCAYKNIPTPFAAYNILESMKRSGPVRLFILGTPITLQCTIENLSLSEEGGDVGTLYYDLELKETRDPVVRKILVVDQSATLAEEKRTDPKASEGTYTVVSGDSLWKIAQMKLGSGARYPEIASLNNIKPKYIIHPGDVLKLPAKG